MKVGEHLLFYHYPHVAKLSTVEGADSGIQDPLGWMLMKESMSRLSSLTVYLISGHLSTLVFSIIFLTHATRSLMLPVPLLKMTLCGIACNVQHSYSAYFRLITIRLMLL